ncbi:hypothetical protein E1A91_D03G035100v1 [Gossypium mustelinum]|uniref:BHLH domain-containing protein n=3 Tax=Gossypium TaxID=3633 RepID=A0A5D2VI69_GOSMU|nr:hypothetical protein ES288_D03G037600v1 [Gossypium darwinii]TYH79079.1 hypothetical protein ES332_D03G036900v1 [Gossypium tomentosum]TYI89161.1 hypothetical protein E1A91_D03G035100v1 [Gossypium mustelinum]
MEIISNKWISEVEMVEDPTFFPQFTIPNMDYSFDDTNFQSFSSESYSSYPNINNGSSNIQAFHQGVDDNEFKRPMKQLKTDNNWNFSINENIPPPPPPPKASSSSSPSSHIISFHNSNPSPAVSQQYYEITKKVGSTTRTPLHAQDHVIAERKRREKLSQRFISLSALIPGLKKTDKASVLGDAIKYMKQLQEKVATLEEQAAKKATESVILVKKSQIYADDETSSSDENFDSNQTNNKLFPEIEARVSDKDVLIRIHCEKNKGFISNIMNEVEKLHLCVLNTNVLPFGQATLDITIVAQMEAEFSMTVKDLVKSLRLALLKFM